VKGIVSNMKTVECRTAKEVYSALKSGDIPNIVEGAFSIGIGVGSPHIIISEKASPIIVCSDTSSPRIKCWGSSSPTVECRGSSSPRIACGGDATPRIMCGDNSTPTIECSYSSSPRIECSDTSSPRIGCWGSSFPKIEAKDDSHIRILYGSPHITATPSVRVSILRGDPTIIGTTQISKITEDTPEAWCQFYGVPIQPDGAVILFKALHEGYKAHNDFQYLPGSCPVAPDWDDGKKEFGGGLHFSPNPRDALRFNIWASHFVACPILLSEIKTHMISGVFPEKVKAPRVFKPCYEVDILGNPLTPENQT
jgi:hypothetical protein